MDENIRAMYAEVPVIATWDDHETTNNWWAGELLEDDRYTIRDVNTLAARGRRAWQEYQPIADVRAMAQDDGFEPARIYRRIERGPDLDVFVLDMRTHKGENTDGLEQQATPILGEEQLQWLLRGLKTSTIFGPRVDFQKAGPTLGSPRDGAGQFFGRVEVAPQGEAFTVELIDANGDVQYTRTLTPQR